MVELAKFLSRRRALRGRLPKGFGARWNPTIGRIDDDGAARFAVDSQHALARIEPEVVVAANRATRLLRDALDEGGFARGKLALFAALRRWRAVGVARRIAELGDLLRAILDRRRLLVGENHLLLAKALERRQRRITPITLKVGFAVRRSRQRPRLGDTGRGLPFERRQPKRASRDRSGHKGQCRASKTNSLAPPNCAAEAPPYLTGLLAQVAVHQLFDELDALELPQSGAGLDATIQRHLIFHGRVNVLGSSIVASYRM